MLSLHNRSPGPVLLLMGLVASTAYAGTSDHRYKQGEHVELWVNKVRWFNFTIHSLDLDVERSSVGLVGLLRLSFSGVDNDLFDLFCAFCCC